MKIVKKDWLFIPELGFDVKILKYNEKIALVSKDDFKLWQAEGLRILNEFEYKKIGKYIQDSNKKYFEFNNEIIPNLYKYKDVEHEGGREFFFKLNSHNDYIYTYDFNEFNSNSNGGIYKFMAFVTKE